MAERELKGRATTDSKLWRTMFSHFLKGPDIYFLLTKRYGVWSYHSGFITADIFVGLPQT